jgi:peroxiredoxin
MGMEAIFVHLVNTYHAKKETPWIDSTQLYKMVDKAHNLEFSLLGKRAYPVIGADTAGKTVALYDVRAKYTVLIFWDCDCGHCKKEIPQLAKIYHDKLKAKGVEVFAIESEAPVASWHKFIRENNLDWINVGIADEYQRAVFKKAYDVYSTPTMYVLDENKIIKAKRLGPDQMADYIDYLEKQKAAKEKSIK